jgi:hypothetical protein
VGIGPVHADVPAGEAALQVAPGTTQSVDGDAAARLHALLPPEPGSEAPRHFRSLLIGTGAGQPAVRISCQSATWRWTGTGRTEQYTLVPTPPRCEISGLAQMPAEVEVLAVPQALQRADAASALP